MLTNQTLDKLDALGLFGMGLGLREQLESNQYLSLRHTGAAQQRVEFVSEALGGARDRAR